MALFRVFLSTLPARGATDLSIAGRRAGLISIHAPREGSDAEFASVAMHEVVSLHAPREGSDATLLGSAACTINISIHAPREGSDAVRDDSRHAARLISIHAPREGSDRPPYGRPSRSSYFYPRSPRGERRRYFTTKIK